jgi:hypothetical protein
MWIFFTSFFLKMLSVTELRDACVLDPERWFDCARVDLHFTYSKFHGAKLEEVAALQDDIEQLRSIAQPLQEQDAAIFVDRPSMTQAKVYILRRNLGDCLDVVAAFGLQDPRRIDWVRVKLGIACILSGGMAMFALGVLSGVDLPIGVGFATGITLLAAKVLIDMRVRKDLVLGFVIRELVKFKTIEFQGEELIIL